MPKARRWRRIASMFVDAAAWELRRGRTNRRKLRHGWRGEMEWRAWVGAEVRLVNSIPFFTFGIGSFRCTMLAEPRALALRETRALHPACVFYGVFVLVLCLLFGGALWFAASVVVQQIRLWLKEALRFMCIANPAIPEPLQFHTDKSPNLTSVSPNTARHGSVKPTYLGRY